MTTRAELLSTALSSARSTTPMPRDEARELAIRHAERTERAAARFGHLMLALGIMFVLATIAGAGFTVFGDAPTAAKIGAAGLWVSNFGGLKVARGLHKDAKDENAAAMKLIAAPPLALVPDPGDTEERLAA
jgi:hypothetical protein